MFRFLILALLVASFATAQNKKPLPNKKTKTSAVEETAARTDSSSVAEEDSVEVIPREFLIYSKRAKNKKRRMQLCLNLVNGDSIYNHCFNDSICRDPEFYRILFQTTKADSTYMLIYVRAFSKPADKPSCMAGKEVKLFYVRMSQKTNKAKIKRKSIESCMRNITNMTKEPIESWDGVSPLVIDYYRGGGNFLQVTFDPKNYLSGFQKTTDDEDD